MTRPSDSVRVAIVGGAGYGGGELLRLLLPHPKVRIEKVTSRRHAGEPVWGVHPNLRGITSLPFSDEPIDELAEDSDVVFFAAPHGVAMQEFPRIRNAKVVVYDLSGDFRLQDAAVFKHYYQMDHAAPQLLGDFVYGLTESHRTEIRKANRVACPGCFATGALLALLPLAKAGWLKGRVVVDSKTGSSGAGAEPATGTHHPERAQDFRAYKILRHQHTPEIEQELKRQGASGLDLAFVTHSTPMVRGIFTTAYAWVDQPAEAVRDLYAEAYRNEPFIRIVEESPRSSIVRGTNFCDLAIASDGKRVVVTGAIDNLTKGGAGQAVQNLNVRFGWEERTGLEFSGLHP